MERNHEESTRLLKEALVVTAELGYPIQILPVLQELANASADAGRFQRAARLFGAAEGRRSVRLAGKWSATRLAHRAASEV